MLQEQTAVDSDWDVERVTVGRNFVRDMEELWSQILRLAAVIEEVLDQSVRALCDGRVDLAEELKRQKRAVNGWEVQIERAVRSNPRLASAGCFRSAARGGRSQDQRRSGAPVRSCPPHCQAGQETCERSRGYSHFPGARESGSRLSDPAPRQPGRVDSIRCFAGTGRDRSRSASRLGVPRGSKRNQGRNCSRPGSDRHLAAAGQYRADLERIADHASKIAEAVIYLKHGAILRHRAVRTSSDSSSGESDA